MTRSGGDVLFPPRDAMPPAGEDDPLEYYYRPLTRRLYRARLRLAGELLGPGPFARVLEVGYATGIFLPELARRSEELVAVDVHEAIEPVAAMLARLGVDAELRSGSVLELPFRDAGFDAVVCLSVLEHLRELDVAIAELRRVLRPGGVAVLGFPVRNAITDRFFRVLGYDPRSIHPSSHADILAAAGRQDGFAVEQVERLPRFVPLALAGYVGARLRAR